MSQFTYSITITHYNASLLLERMLKSIPEREDIQVIVVDDNSKANEKVAIKQLKHKNMEMVFTPENHGAGYERNVGLSHVKGKWLIACDCDDMFADGAFDVLDQYVNSEYDYICYCVDFLDNTTLKPNGKKLRSDTSVRNFINNNNEKTLKYFKFLNGEPWNKLISVRFINDNNICWEDCRINVDVLFSFLVALKAKKYLAIPNVLYHFVGDGNSITRKKRSIEREFEFYLAVQKRNGFFKVLGYGYPFYRSDFLYLPFLLVKRGVKDTIAFFKYRKAHCSDVLEARQKYIKYLDGVDISHILD